MKIRELLNKLRTQVEIYKPVKGHDRYFVSSLGNVKNIKTGRVLKPVTNSKGYHVVDLCSNGKASHFKIHRLVAQAFVPNPENKPQVNHRNEIKADNRLANLEWMTPQENNNWGTHNQRISLSKKGKHLILGEDGKRHWKFLEK